MGAASAPEWLSRPVCDDTRSCWDRDVKMRVFLAQSEVSSRLPVPDRLGLLEEEEEEAVARPQADGRRQVALPRARPNPSSVLGMEELHQTPEGPLPVAAAYEMRQEGRRAVGERPEAVEALERKLRRDVGVGFSSLAVVCKSCLVFSPKS